MARITKADYYRQRGRQYRLQDAEAAIRYRRAIAWIEARHGQTVVDVGCKFGLLRQYLRDRNLDYMYVGIDIDAGTLRRIASVEVQESRESFICHDVNAGLPMESDSADYVVCLEVMEHLENASTFLEEARRVLKPNGRVVVSVPNPYCWMEVLGNLLSRADGEGHVASFTWQNIDALARFGGMRVERRGGTFTRLPFTKRLLGRYLLVETGAFFLTRSSMYLLSAR